MIPYLWQQSGDERDSSCPSADKIAFTLPGCARK